MLNKFKLYKLKKKLKLKDKNIGIFSDIIISNISMIKFGDFIYIGEKAKIYGKGNLFIGDHVIIGPNISVYTSVHNYDSDYLPYGFQDKIADVYIGESVWIGADVSLLPGVKIGEGAVVGLGSIVTKDVPPFSVVAGNPAKIIASRDKEYYYKLKEKGKFYLKAKWNKS